MQSDQLSALFPFLTSLALGLLIGLERERKSWSAGLRTHMLVALGSALVMIVSTYGFDEVLGNEHVALDPSRMAAQVVSGIGFLGAGAILLHGEIVRGLTTAASIWITAAIGILLGIGFYLPAVLATLITVATLSIFRWIESRIPSHSYAHHFVRFDRDNVMPEQELKDYLENLGFKVANMSHRLSDDGLHFEYRMVIWTTNPQNLSQLASALRELKAVRAFRISPTGD